MVNWEWFNKPEMVSVFIYCLLKANYEDGEFHGTPIKRGQFITSPFKISTATGLSYQRVRTVLNQLSKTHEINKQSTNKYTIITICNYDNYQSEQQTKPKQTPNKQRANATKSTTIKEIEEVEEIEETNIQRVYSAYPNKCPIKNTSTGKCQKSKFKIQALLKTHTVDELVSMIEAYKTECISAKRYIKNFDTFLNNLPDLSEQELPINQVSSKKAYFQSIYPKDDITPTAERVLTEKFDGFQLAYKENLADYNISLQDILDQPIDSIRFAIDGGHIKKRQ